MAKKQPTIVTKKGDASFVKMFDTPEQALDFTGPEYDKLGYIVTSFERRQETYFEPVEFDGMVMDQTENGRKLNGTEG